MLTKESLTTHRHVVTVTYTHVSDEIRLVCSCGWKADLGDGPTFDRALDVVYDHRRGAKDLAR